MSANHERALDALLRRGRLRALEPARGIDFTSNDYLGLAQSQVLADAVADAIARGVPVGAGGSRLLRGNHPEHEALEAEAAKFFGAETALFFGGGFIASTALLAALPARGDVIVYDELIHASVHEGMRLSKADRAPARHNDPQSFADAIMVWRAAGGTGQPWIVVESLYSMDGDRAPIDELADLAKRNDAMLIIDEAHATGVFGPDGRGLAAQLEGRQNVITVHTCGKALGVMGALVLAPRTIHDFLVNRARAFIYATAPSPLVAAALGATTARSIS
jgi:8-amino-7-oxononanoate synthase